MKNTPPDELIHKKYNEADAVGKELLEGIYGKNAFTQNNYHELKTLEDCCKKEKYDPLYIKVQLPEQLAEFQNAMQGHLEALIIAKAIRNGYEPNFKESSYKYFPCFIMGDKAGVGFSFVDSVCVSTDAGVGSRLVFEEKEQSDYFGMQFSEIHKKRLL